MSGNKYSEQLENLDRQIEAKSIPAVDVAVNQPVEWWSVASAMTISVAVLIFGVVLMLITTWLLSNRSRSAESVLRVMGTLLIIISAVFLVVAGYSDKQIAPVMGLLGTIAGYLLGRSSSARSPQNSSS